MLKSQIDPAALLAAVIAAALALMLLPGTFAWLASIGGLSLVFILLAYDRDGYRSVFQSLAFAGVFALCVTLAVAIIFRLIAASNGEAQVNGQFATQWLPALWACVTVVFWPIDRARMTARVQYGGDLVSTPLASGPIITPRFNAPVPVTAAPSATFVHPERVSDFTAPAPPPPEAFPQQRPTPTAAYNPPPPLSYEATPASQPAAAPQPAPPAPVARPQPAPPPPPPPVAVPMRGKETMIYVTLIGEGMNFLRSVRAEHLGRDFYRIIDTVPDGETWEYGPGQVVKCKKKNLSSGKAMVAVEEAPRAR